MGHPLSPVFAPRSVAVIGASADPAKRGFQILRALDESGFAGPVHPVNPKGGEIRGRAVVPSVAELPEGVDLAVLCTPAGSTPELVRACGERGVRGALVLAVGFGESGPEGAALERELLRAARETGVRLVGPNTSGLLNLHRGLNLIGARGVRPGGIALLVQSGNMALALMNEATDRTGEGISACVGVGNELDVGFGEALDYLGQDEATRAVLVHAEGIRDARGFLEVASRVSRTTPVVMIKAGRSAEGAGAALSHTGAVAGPYDRLRAGLERCGVAVVERTDELMPVAVTLAGQPPVAGGRGVAILSDGGGQGTLAVDALEDRGVPLWRPGEPVRARLRELLGPAAAVRNPVDLAGAADADPRVFARALELLASDDGVGAVLVVGLFGGYHIRFAEGLEEAERAAAGAMAETMALAGKGLVVHSMYASSRSEPLGALERAGVPVVESLDTACRCVAELVAQEGRARSAPWVAEAGGSVRPSTLPEWPAGRRPLGEVEARALLETFGVAFPPHRVVGSEDEAAAALQDLGTPVVVKVAWDRIVHKADAGGVVLGVRTADEARAAFRSVGHAVEAFAAAHRLDPPAPSAFVTPMASPPAAEVLVGAYRDPSLGPVLTLGFGGSWVEVVAEVAHRVLPVDDAELAAMLRHGRLAALLDRADDGGGLARRRVVRVARAVADCILAVDRVAEIEINPLFVYRERAVPIDARVVLSD